MNYGNRYEKNREDEAPEHGRKEDVRAFFVRLRLGPLDDFVTRARRHRSAWPGGVRCQTRIDFARIDQRAKVGADSPSKVSSQPCRHGCN